MTELNTLELGLNATHGGDSNLDACLEKNKMSQLHSVVVVTEPLYIENRAIHGPQI